MELLLPGQIQASAKQYVSLAPDGSIWSYQRLRDSEGSQIVYQSTVMNVQELLLPQRVI